ncbi:hypothetical protein Anapl_08725 [Anas platyrhynchos]|uniref:Uncharacterized protein n=1 Tax=Anas platyrhynchos TaxID=8839 RepID=R0JLM1_ANAPL|nr:hypothetical protein Anapl_08725 [Anas platyrhynchos]
MPFEYAFGHAEHTRTYPRPVVRAHTRTRLQFPAGLVTQCPAEGRLAAVRLMNEWGRNSAPRNANLLLLSEQQAAAAAGVIDTYFKQARARDSRHITLHMVPRATDSPPYTDSTFCFIKNVQAFTSSYLSGDILLSLGHRCERHPVLAAAEELPCCNLYVACCDRTELSLRYPEFGWRQSSGNRLKGGKSIHTGSYHRKTGISLDHTLIYLVVICSCAHPLRCHSQSEVRGRNVPFILIVSSLVVRAVIHSMGKRASDLYDLGPVTQSHGTISPSLDYARDNIRVCFSSTTMKKWRWFGCKSSINHSDYFYVTSHRSSRVFSLFPPHPVLLRIAQTIGVKQTSQEGPGWKQSCPHQRRAPLRVGGSEPPCPPLPSRAYTQTRTHAHRHAPPAAMQPPSPPVQPARDPRAPVKTSAKKSTSSMQISPRLIQIIPICGSPSPDLANALLQTTSSTRSTPRGTRSGPQLGDRSIALASLLLALLIGARGEVLSAGLWILSGRHQVVLLTQLSKHAVRTKPSPSTDDQEISCVPAGTHADFVSSVPGAEEHQGAPSERQRGRPLTSVALAHLVVQQENKPAEKTTGPKDVAGAREPLTAPLGSARAVGALLSRSIYDRGEDSCRRPPPAKALDGGHPLRNQCCEGQVGLFLTGCVDSSELKPHKSEPANSEDIEQ